MLLRVVERTCFVCRGSWVRLEWDEMGLQRKFPLEMRRGGRTTTKNVLNHVGHFK